MILEIAILNVIPSRSEEFERVFTEAAKILSSSPGFMSLELQKCVETSNRYALLVRWESIEDHTKGFRKSENYQQWRKLLHHFYHPFPQVEHYEKVLEA